MKLKFLPLLFLSIFALVSCSDDDDDPIVSPVEIEKHFKGTELDLTVSGNKVIGKDVMFTPDASDPTLATLTFLGERFDVDAAMNGARAGEAAGYTTSSVFAGETEVKLPITMTVTGDLGTFEGKGESQYYTYDYKGNVLSSQLSIELSNVVLKNTKLAGTSWTLEPIGRNKWGNIETVPIIFQWNSEKNLEIELFGSKTEYSMTQILALVMSIGIIPAEDGKKITIPEMLEMMLQGVQFENDGNLIASYFDRKTMQPKTSPKGLANYVVINDNKMKLILNPFAIAADAAANKGNEDKEPSQMAEIMSGLTPMILDALNADKQLSEGIDINYSIENDKLLVNIDETLLLPLLKTFAPMLQNPDLINTIVEKIKQNPEMAPMAPMLESVLKQFPEVINTTTKIELGLKFDKK